jgi:hypothetical protein
MFALQIESEKKRVAELEAQIKAYDARAMERRRTMGGTSSACCARALVLTCGPRQA